MVALSEAENRRSTGTTLSSVFLFRSKKLNNPINDLRTRIVGKHWGEVSPEIIIPVGGTSFVHPADKLDLNLVTLADAANILTADPDLWPAFERLVEAASNG